MFFVNIADLDEVDIHLYNAPDEGIQVKELISQMTPDTLVNLTFE